ncbi:conserved membrane hypothetical protein [Microbacterium sp. 8M]|uniref:hypothetical protein n=1 Tax=Microbacterium sp. 8M TaxID=2653153 RepID=UPI0012EFEB30|nr:hypothetical protein [Microbacterium sp. 8M]VXB18891.1 conserved membrane hypothetical protein [Microbacterium sp. 8M]
MLHAAVMLLMAGSAITAAVCCLLAGRVAPGAVPWQARQSAVVMALGMIVLCVATGDPGVLLLVTACGIGSAMLGVVGIRGRVHADACFHRALGCVVMAVCALALLGARGAAAGSAVPVAGHSAHGALVPMTVVAVLAAAALLGLMVIARVRHGGVAVATGRRRSQGWILLETEGAAMALSLVVMAAMLLVR